LWNCFYFESYEPKSKTSQSPNAPNDLKFQHVVGTGKANIQTTTKPIWIFFKRFREIWNFWICKLFPLLFHKTFNLQFRDTKLLYNKQYSILYVVKMNSKIGLHNFGLYKIIFRFFHYLFVLGNNSSNHFSNWLKCLHIWVDKI